jgi:hypothetical protein
MREFDAGIVRREAPVDPLSPPHCARVPRPNLLAQRYPFFRPLVQTLPLRTPNSISAMFSQLPCFGV